MPQNISALGYNYGRTGGCKMEGRKIGRLFYHRIINTQIVLLKVASIVYRHNFLFVRCYPYGGVRKLHAFTLLSKLPVSAVGK